MLGVLFAQEVRTTWKTLVVTVGITLLVAAVSLTAGALRVPVLGAIGLVVGVLAIAMITPLVLALLAESYWRTMYGREGYFTMAIPVRGRTLFAAKVLYGVAATLLALVITLAGAAGALVAFALSEGGSVALAFAGLRETLASVGAGTLWLLAACILLQFVFTVVAGAAVMSVGAEARFNHLGFGAPVLGGVIVYFAMQIIGLAAMLFVPFGMRITGPDAGALVAEGMLHEFLLVLRDPAAGSEPSVIGLGIVPVSLIVTALLAWLGARSVDRRTSLR